MLKTTIAVAFAVCVAHSEELERKNVKDLFALREERRLGSWDTTGGSGSGSGSGSASVSGSKSWSSSWDTEPDAPSTTVYQCGCDAYLQNDNGNNDNGGADNGGENGGENGGDNGGEHGGDNGGENGGENNSGSGTTGSGSGSGSKSWSTSGSKSWSTSGSKSWSASGSKSWSTSGSKSGSWSSDSMESSTQPPRPKYDSFCDCMCDCEGSGEYVIVEDNNDGGNNNNNDNNNNNNDNNNNNNENENNNDNSGSSWSTSSSSSKSSKSSKSSTSSWSSGSSWSSWSSWSSSNPCGSNSVSGGDGSPQFRRRMGKSWSTDTTSGGSKGWSTDSGSGSYDEPCPSTTVASNDDDMTSTMYASTSGTQGPPPRPETTMITCQCNGTTEEPWEFESTTEACPENSNYFILSRGWDISSLEDDISLHGRYDQDGSKFVNSDTNYTIWFEARSGEYQLAVGDPWEDDLILFYIEPVSSWTDDSNPLTNSDDESLWETNGESVEFQTGNMTLYDCNGENLGTDVYTSYSHIYVSGSINIIPTYGIYALMAVMYMVAVMF